MKAENIVKIKELIRKLDALNRELADTDLAKCNSDKGYIVSWADNLGFRHECLYVSPELMIPVIQAHREDLIKRKEELEKELEEM